MRGTQGVAARRLRVRLRRARLLTRWARGCPRIQINDPETRRRGSRDVPGRLRSDRSVGEGKQVTRSVDLSKPVSDDFTLALDQVGRATDVSERTMNRGKRRTDCVAREGDRGRG